VTLTDWVRQTLHAAAWRHAEGDTARKLAVVREAARHAYPTADVEPMLDELEAGFSRRLPR